LSSFTCFLKQFSQRKALFEPSLMRWLISSALHTGHFSSSLAQGLQSKPSQIISPSMLKLACSASLIPHFSHLGLLLSLLSSLLGGGELGEEGDEPLPPIGLSSNQITLSLSLSLFNSITCFPYIHNNLF
jgi:hypothetical protein